MTWQTEDVKRLARMRHLPDVVGDYPLEVGLAAWGFLVGLITVVDLPPSGALAALPNGLDTAWGLAMTVGSISVIFGLVKRQISPAIANAMLLFGIVFLVYAIAVLQSSGWERGGAVAALTAMLAVVCFLRAHRLRTLWRVLLREAQRQEAGDRRAP